MATENDPTDRSLVQTNPAQRALAEVTSPYAGALQAAGFSSRLPELVMQVNDVLLVPTVTAVGFSVVPGETPMLNPYLEHSGSGYRFDVKGRPGGQRSEFHLRAGANEEIFPHLILTFADLHGLMQAAYPNRRAVFRAEPATGYSSDYPPREVDIAEVDENALDMLVREEEVPSERFRDSFDHFRPYRHFAIIVENQEAPFAQFNLEYAYDYRNNAKKIIAQIIGINFEGKTPEVEAFMEILSQELRKPKNYPFHDSIEDPK